MYIQMLSCELGTCCGDPGIAVLLNSASKVIDLIQIVVPILLMVMASIRFTQMVMNPERKGGLASIRNMFVASALVFFVPVFVNVVLSWLPDSFTISACWQQAKIMAEATRTTSYQYVSPYEKENRSSTIVNPSDYQKGTPKPSGSSSYAPGNMAPGDAKGILEGAEKVHTMYEQNKWFYYTSLGQLRWNDIKYSTNNPSRATCCATFVGSALYVGGVFTEAEMNQHNYNSPSGISHLCEAHGWIKITSYSQLAAGDVVVMSGPKGGSKVGHVQIYAGNGTWYNAGSTSAIQRDSPYSGDGSSRFLWAWRKPA